MGESTKPRRVVIVDADNPLEEIHGEFFWREDHERLLAAARAESFDLGRVAGLQAVGRSPSSRVVMRVRRSGTLLRSSLLAFMVLVVAAYLIALFTA